MVDVSRLPAGCVLLALIAIGASCVSVPRPVGAVLLEGPTPARDSGQAMGAADRPGAPRGPLVLRDATLRATSAGWEWAVTVVNPSNARFEVSLVVSLLDNADTTLAFVSRELELGAGDEQPLGGALEAEADPTRFRVEYWVRPPPPPERRIERIGP